MRRIYYNIYNEFILPREVRLTRTLMGLPAEEPRRNNAQNRNAQRNGEGGVIGFLQSIIDALDPEDERADGQPQDREVVLDVEVVIEDERAGGEEQEEEQGRQEVGGDEEVAAPAEAPEVGVPDIQANVEEPRQDQNQDHEAPPAPPANRPGLGVILRSLSNGLVSALALPGVCFAVGEVLRVALPATRQNGLLKQQWGRSLVGGCLYVVIRDAARLYAKHRKVQALANRRVKNVERARRNQG